MYVNSRSRPRRRGLGTVSTMVNGQLIYGSDPVGVPRNNLRYPPNRFYPPVWGDGAGVVRGPYGFYPGPTVDGMNLAQLQALYQSNPSALTPQQFARLQAAGTIAGTVPYSSVTPPTNTGIDPATGISYAQEASNAALAAATPAASSIGTALQALYAGIPLYAWIGAAAGAYFLFGRSGRR